MSAIDTSTPETDDPEEGSIPEENADARELLEKIKAREDFFEKGWWKYAETATKIFNSEKEDKDNPYNILYSNTEVLKPSLYSATPKPDVRSRFEGKTPFPLTQLVENLLVVYSDPSIPGEESLDLAMGDAVSSALIAGMGFIRLRHYPEKAFPLCSESGHYRGLIWAAGRKWGKLPWIAFRHELTKEEFFSQFQIPETERKNFTSTVQDDDEDPNGKNTDNSKTIVYECWKKDEREIYYLCEDWAEILVKQEKDTLKLAGFYPTPGLLLMTKKPGRLIPTPLYQYYRSQAEELNRVSARLNKVLAAIKVRGAYNSLLGDEMAAMLSDDQMENALVPAKEAGLLAQNGGFEKQIWLLPIEKLVEVATQLYNARQQIKQVIYEITGLSDIIRGSSIASETATAQNLKAKWGSIRIRDMQKAISEYVRDLYRLTVDAATTIIPPDQWKAITKSDLLTNQEKQIAVQQLMYEQQLGRPVDPAQAQKLQSPTLDDAIKTIASDIDRGYTINVQSDSTVDLDTATDKAEVAEFMQVMGQLMTGLQPLAGLGPSGLDAAKSILIAMCQKFKFGLGIVDSLKGLQAPPPPAPTGPTPEQMQKEKDLQSQEQQLQAQEKQLQTILSQLKDAKSELEIKQVKFDADVKVFQAEQKAAQDVQAVQTQVQEKDKAVQAANDTVTHVKRQAELSTSAAASRAQQKVAAKTNQEMSPVIQTMTQAITELQNAVKMLAQPRIARKGPDGSWATEIATP